MLHDHDDTVTLYPSYEDSPNAPPITEISKFPSTFTKIAKYWHVKNPYTIRKPWVDKDGNKRAQSPTLITLVMSSKRSFEQLLGTLSLCFLSLNIRVSIKGIDALEERNLFALVGLSNQFDKEGLHRVLDSELDKKVQAAHEQGKWRDHPEGWEKRDRPFFLLQPIKARIPPESEEITAEYREAMESVTNGRTYIAVVVAEHERKWAMETFLLLKGNDNLKEALSRCMSIIEIPGEVMDSAGNDLFHRNMAYHWGYNVKHMVTTIQGVQSTTTRVRVKRQDGKKPDYKYTNLKRELWGMKTGSECEGTIGSSLIEGIVMVHGHTPDGGCVQISHARTAGIRELTNNIAENIAAYLYKLLTVMKGFTESTALNLISRSLTPETRRGANMATFDTVTLLVTPSRRSQQAKFINDMHRRGVTLEIPQELREQMDRRAREGEEAKAAMREQIAGEFGLKEHPNQPFSLIDSQASAATDMTHTTDGQMTFRSFNTTQINDAFYDRADELCSLRIKVREMDPDHEIFNAPGYRLEDEEVSVTSMDEIDRAIKFAAMRKQVNELRKVITEIEQSSTSPNPTANELKATAGTQIRNASNQEDDKDDGPLDLRGGGERGEVEMRGSEIAEYKQRQNQDNAVPASQLTEGGEDDEEKSGRGAMSKRPASDDATDEAHHGDGDGDGTLGVECNETEGSHLAPHLARALKKYRLTAEEEEKLAQSKEERRAAGLPTMDNCDRLAMKKRHYETCLGLHKKTGYAKVSMCMRPGEPRLTALLERVRKEEESEEERERQAEERIYNEDTDESNDTNIGGYCRMDKATAEQKAMNEAVQEKSGTGNKAKATNGSDTDTPATTSVTTEIMKEGSNGVVQEANLIHHFYRGWERISTNYNVEAEASTAFDEATTGSPPPNSGSAAPSSPRARRSLAEDGSGVVQES